METEPSTESCGEDIKVKICQDPECLAILPQEFNFCPKCGKQAVNAHDDQTASPVDADAAEDTTMQPIHLKKYFEMPGNKSEVVDRVKFVQEQMNRLLKDVKGQLMKYTNFHKNGKKANRMLKEALSSIHIGGGKTLKEHFGDKPFNSFLSSMKTVASFTESPVNIKLVLDLVEEVTMMLVMAYRIGTDLVSFLTTEDKESAMMSLKSKFETTVSHVWNNGDLYKRTFVALTKLCTQELVYTCVSMLVGLYENRDNSLLVWVFENPMRTVGFIALVIAFLTALWCAYLHLTRSGDDDDED